MSPTLTQKFLDWLEKARTPDYKRMGLYRWVDVDILKTDVFDALRSEANQTLRAAEAAERAARPQDVSPRPVLDKAARELARKEAARAQAAAFKNHDKAMAEALGLPPTTSMDDVAFAAVVCSYNIQASKRIAPEDKEVLLTLREPADAILKELPAELADHVRDICRQSIARRYGEKMFQPDL